ncbi:hypothetical protein [Brenneria corticis]|nr:hypothetical protein [Brenneria sp. CFCC 11842]
MKTEFNDGQCQTTAVGTLCPQEAFIKRIKDSIDPTAVTRTQY